VVSFLAIGGRKGQQEPCLLLKEKKKALQDMVDGQNDM